MKEISEDLLAATKQRFVTGAAADGTLRARRRWLTPLWNSAWATGLRKSTCLTPQVKVAATNRQSTGCAIALADFDPLEHNARLLAALREMEGGGAGSARAGGLKRIQSRCGRQSGDVHAATSATT